MTKEETFTIAALALEFKVTSRAIRFYEDQGLIHPKREGQSRIYTKGDRARLAWILRGKSVGFSLHEIGELLDLYALEDGREKQRIATLEHCYVRLKALKKQKEDIGFMINELEDFCQLLESAEVEQSLKKANS